MTTVVIYHNDGNTQKFERTTFSMDRNVVIAGGRRFPLAGIARVEAHDDKPET